MGVGIIVRKSGSGNLKQGLSNFFGNTFTPCGAHGRNGPTLETCRDYYKMDWALDNDSFTHKTQGIQQLTIPRNGYYFVLAAGAQGGNATSTNSPPQVIRRGGRGMVVRGTVYLYEGQKINIIAGQQGGGISTTRFSLQISERSGGGGGSFVWIDENDIPLICAGGGGGASGDPGTGQVGIDAQTGTSGTRSGSNNGTAGTDGNGAVSSGGSFRAGAGAGFFTNGSGAGSGRDGLSPLNGGLGGTCNPSSGHEYDGGFGGGGADARLNSTSYDSEGIGGGGGYSGGAGGNESGDEAGGGAGSYACGDRILNPLIGGLNSGDGYVSIIYTGKNYE